MQYNKQEYLRYLEKKSPDSPMVKNCLWAFFVGGGICVIGQLFLDLYQKGMSLPEEQARTAVSITMIFLGALFTGLDLYCRLGKYAGAGTLVPITGFANAIVSPAMEFKKEGLVLGLAAKMFVIAGPVLVYGITASVVVGFVYWLMQLFGIGG